MIFVLGFIVVLFWGFELWGFVVGFCSGVLNSLVTAHNCVQKDTHKCVGKRLLEGLSSENRSILTKKRSAHHRPFVTFYGKLVTLPNASNAAKPVQLLAVLSTSPVAKYHAANSDRERPRGKQLTNRTDRLNPQKKRSIMCNVLGEDAGMLKNHYDFPLLEFAHTELAHDGVEWWGNDQTKRWRIRCRLKTWRAHKRSTNRSSCSASRRHYHCQVHGEETRL